MMLYRLNTHVHILAAVIRVSSTLDDNSRPLRQAPALLYKQSQDRPSALAQQLLPVTSALNLPLRSFVTCPLCCAICLYITA